MMRPLLLTIHVHIHSNTQSSIIIFVRYVYFHFKCSIPYIHLIRTSSRYIQHNVILYMPVYDTTTLFILIFISTYIFLFNFTLKNWSDWRIFSFTSFWNATGIRKSNFIPIIKSSPFRPVTTPSIVNVVTNTAFLCRTLTKIDADN